MFPTPGTSVSLSYLDDNINPELGHIGVRLTGDQPTAKIVENLKRLANLIESGSFAT